MRQTWLDCVTREFQVFAGEILDIPAGPPRAAALTTLLARIPPVQGPIEPLVLAQLVAQAQSAAAHSGLFVSVAARVRAHIDRHFAEPLTLHAIAREFGTQPQVVAQAFRVRYGTTIHAHTQQQRLSAAMAMLARGEKVEAVARCVGFGSRNTLYRLIRQRTGTTPRQAAAQHAAGRSPARRVGD